MASNAIQCYDDRDLNVNLNGETVSVGQFWSAWLDLSSPDQTSRFCVEMTDTNDPGGTPFLVQNYTDCYGCLADNYALLGFSDCLGNFNPTIPISEFGSIPTENTTYYMTIGYYERGIFKEYTSCFRTGTYREMIKMLPKSEYEVYLTNNKFQTIESVIVTETSCETCLSNNSFTYEVTRCLGGDIDYVSLINNSYIKHLISYSDGINQYCGTVQQIGVGSPTWVFINDYGLSDGSGGTAICDDCLATENEKILLVSCTDSEVSEVVWASALYDGGEVSNLSTDAGCFEVIGLTEDPVTIDSFLNFDPQPGCEPCIECNGINYTYTTCSGYSSGTIKSYQYLSGDTVFFNPAINECCYVTGTASGYYDDTLYSVEAFGSNSETGCEDCNNNVDIVIWNASACTASNTYSSFYVTTDSTAVQGDVVKLMWGSNEWICAQLLNTTSSYSGGYTYYNTQDNGSGTTLRYDSCENCNSQGLIGVTLVSCDAPYTEQFVSISLENYLQIYNFGSLTNYSVSDQQGNCFTITNVCPIPLTEEGFTPVAFYLNCFICNEENPDNVPRSAGTEVFVCEICCDCGATGSTITQVTPPHPVWTDGYGTAVTQLNMIVLGGPNGLNN